MNTLLERLQFRAASFVQNFMQSLLGGDSLLRLTGKILMRLYAVAFVLSSQPQVTKIPPWLNYS